MVKRFIIKTLIALCMILPLFAGGMAVNAENEQPKEMSVLGSKEADPRSLNVENRTTTVTLSLPAAEYKNSIDIVFVADTSSSTTNENINFGENIAQLFEDILEMNPNLDIKIAIVKFTGIASDGLAVVSDGKYKGLVPYDSEDHADLDAAIDLAINAPSKKDYRKKPENYPNYDEDHCIPGGGSGLHCGLVMADELLAADETVENSKKYVVMLTDGKTYIWNNKAGEPTTFYTQYTTKYNSVTAVPTTGQATGSYDKTSGNRKKIPQYDTKGYYYGYSETNAASVAQFDVLYNRTDNLISSTETKYDLYCTYAEEGSNKLPGTAKSYNTTNGSTLFTFAPYRQYHVFTPENEMFHGKEVHYFQVNPYAVIDNGDGTYTFDETTLNEECYHYNPDCLQKGLWQAAHLWKDMQTRYNCGAVIYNGWGSGGGLGLAKSFNLWALEPANSKYAADISNTEAVAKMFSDISNDIIYLVGRGVVTDYIADEFTLVMEEGTVPFRMTLGEEAVEAVADGENKWNFGEADDEGVYPYVIEYSEEENKIVWTINVPVAIAKKVTLSYDLLISEEAETRLFENDEHYDTNKSAQLIYDSTDGKYKDQKYDFPVPNVEYDATAPYKVEHYKQKLDGTFELAETEDAKGDANTTATAEPKEYEGFTFDETVEGTLVTEKIKIDGSLVLKLYYTRNKYKVTYTYENDVEGAPAVPEVKEYLFEQEVPAAEVPSCKGYKFEGWTGEVTVMPANDVEVTGKWVEKKVVTIIPDDKTKVYGEEDEELTARIEGLDESAPTLNLLRAASGNEITYKLTREPGENVGEYVISVTDYPEETEDYVVKVETATYTITPKEVTVTVGDYAKKVNEEDPAFEGQVEGLVGDDTVEYNIEREPGEEEGVYALTPVGEADQGNYTVKYVAGTLTITSTPDTGDTSEVALYGAMLMLSGTAAFVIIAVLLKKRYVLFH